LLLPKTFKALNDLSRADVPLRNYSLPHSLTHSRKTSSSVVAETADRTVYDALINIIGK